MSRRLYGTRYTTGCGHSWRRRYRRYTVAEMRHATTDCAVCGKLLIFDPAQFEGAREDCYRFSVHLLLFNTWMHAQDPRWPLNGANTGFVEFGPMRTGGGAANERAVQHTRVDDELHGRWVHDERHGPWHETAPTWAVRELVSVKAMMADGRWAPPVVVGDPVEGHVGHCDGVWDGEELVVKPERDTYYEATVTWSDGTTGPLLLWNNLSEDEGVSDE